MKTHAYPEAYILPLMYGSGMGSGTINYSVLACTDFYGIT
jgi:hypothetical protein